MLGTIIQVAKEMEYEAKEKGLSSEEFRVNHLCKHPPTISKGEIKVLFANLRDKDFHLEDYKSDERWKYLYALPTGKHGIGPSWVADLRGKEKDKEVRKALKEIRKGLEKLKGWVNNEADKELVGGCLAEVSKDSEWLVKEILDRPTSELQILLVVQLNGKKPGEVKGIREAFEKQRTSGETGAKNVGEGVCGVCGAKGMVRSSLPFEFYTVEKRGFCPMAFGGQSWKYAPICEECARWLYIGQSVLDLHLRSRVAGRWAYLVPNLEPKVSKMPERFTQYLWEFRERSSHRIVPEGEDFPEERASSELFEDFMGNWKWDGPPPFRSASLIFHRPKLKPGEKFRFLHITPDILPRQLKGASERLKDLREGLSRGLLGEPGERIFRDLRANFEFIAQSWTWPGQDGVSPLNLDPMRLVECIITQSPPSPSIFWSDVDKILRRMYIEAIRGRDRTVKQIITPRVALLWAIWALLYTNESGGEAMESFEGMKLSQGFWESTFKNKRMLDGNAKRGMFLLGVLFGEVEYQQRRDRDGRKGEMPILNSLRGLTASAEELKRHLFPQLLIKFRQLKGYSMEVSEVEAAASYYLSYAEDTSDEEARFVFCLGWALRWYIINSIREALGKKKEEIEEKEE